MKSVLWLEWEVDIDLSHQYTPNLLTNEAI